jgi:hypothetical protein
MGTVKRPTRREPARVIGAQCGNIAAQKAQIIYRNKSLPRTRKFDFCCAAGAALDVPGRARGTSAILAAIDYSDYSAAMVVGST